MLYFILMNEVMIFSEFCASTSKGDVQMAIQHALPAIRVRTPVHKRRICGKPENEESRVLSRVLADYWQGSRKFRHGPVIRYSRIPFARLTDEGWELLDKTPTCILKRAANKLKSRLFIPYGQAYTRMYRFVTE